MPGRLFLERDLGDLAKVWKASADGIGAEPARRNIAPGQEVLAMTQDRRISRMRWGLIPVGRVNARGRPILETLVNARSETVFDKSAFAGLRRCLVPADGWYEWTGKARRKTAWRISRRDGGLLAFAGVWDVWRAPGGTEVRQVATVTCAPSADVRDIHHRMGVLIDVGSHADWLDGDDATAMALCRPYPDGSLNVEKASDVDWTAP